MKTGRSLRELLSVPGFVASAKLKGIFGDPKARVVQLRRRKKQPFAQIVGSAARDVTTSGRAVCGIFGWQAGWCTWSSNVGGYGVRGAAACM